MYYKYIFGGKKKECFDTSKMQQLIVMLAISRPACRHLHM